MALVHFDDNSPSRLRYLVPMIPTFLLMLWVVTRAVI